MVSECMVLNKLLQRLSLPKILLQFKNAGVARREFLSVFVTEVTAHEIRFFCHQQVVPSCLAPLPQFWQESWHTAKSQPVDYESHGLLPTGDALILLSLKSVARSGSSDLLSGAVLGHGEKGRA